MGCPIPPVDAPGRRQTDLDAGDLSPLLNQGTVHNDQIAALTMEIAEIDAPLEKMAEEFGGNMPKAFALRAQGDGDEPR